MSFSNPINLRILAGPMLIGRYFNVTCISLALTLFLDYCLCLRIFSQSFAALHHQEAVACWLLCVDVYQ
ncbi:hypothetical protein AKJ16_DCAP15382 [Drosera capensis]